MKLRILFTLVVFFSLFGPKFGVIDVSVLVGLFAVTLLTSKRNIKFPHVGIVLVFLVGVTVAYSAAVFIFARSPNEYVVLRGLRALCNTMFLGAFIYNFPLPTARKINTVITVLLINALAVVLQALVPETQTLFAQLYGFDKSIRGLRGFGLTAGYDTAGFLCVMGVVLTSLVTMHSKRAKNLLKVCVFAIAAIFTSRSTMAVLSVTLVTFGGIFIMKYKGYRRLNGIVYITAVGIASLLYFIPLFTSSFAVGEVGPGNLNSSYADFFAYTDLAAWAGHSWTLPNTAWDMFFGSTTAPNSDVGFVRVIYMIGIVGLLLIASVYGLMWVVSLKMLAVSKQGMYRNGIQDLSSHRTLTLAVLLLVPLQVVFNIKNLYFLTRSFYELLVILFFTELWNLKPIPGPGLENGT